MKPLLIVITLVIAGCAVPYVAPTEGPKASIRFINDGQRNLNIAYYEESTNCKGRRKTDVILPTTQVEHVVHANKDLTFEYYLTNYNGSGRESYCLMNLRFHPKEGKIYSFRTSEDAYSCKWLMSDSTKEGTLEPVTLRAIPWKRGFDENSSWCNE